MDYTFSEHRSISIIYHSGSGGTALIARLLERLLSERATARVASVAEPGALTSARDSDFLVLLYPTYFLRPSASMREFIERIGPFAPAKAAYLVATYELYTENSIRACALALKERGVSVVGSRALRSPGSDATCVLPDWACPWLYRFEPRLPVKLASIAAEIEALAREDSAESIPAPKWYTPFAQFAQLTLLNRFERCRGRIRVLDERCSRCGACVAMCDRDAWVMAENGPRHVSERCELCTRCIHRCPSKALVILGPLKDNRRLDARLYAALGDQASRALAEARPEARPETER
jgi:MinD superfamily P-loop ATPase containing an inserted ferredoxin domain